MHLTYREYKDHLMDLIEAQLVEVSFETLDDLSEEELIGIRPYGTFIDEDQIHDYALDYTREVVDSHVQGRFRDYFDYEQYSEDWINDLTIIENSFGETWYHLL